MPIQFNQFRSDWRLPAVFVEFSSRLAFASLELFKTNILVIGQKLNAGTAEAGKPVRVANLAEAESLFGRGSHLFRVLEKMQLAGPVSDIYALPLVDNPAGATATGSILINSAATGNGTLTLYIADRRVQVGVVSGDTAAQIATKLQAAIAANNNLPVTAAVDGTNAALVNLTSQHKGELGNEDRIYANFLGAAASEFLPQGVTVTITQMSGGTANPDLATPLSKTMDRVYNYIYFPYTDASSLNVMDAHMELRWQRKLYGHYFCARRAASLGALNSFGDGRNGEYGSCIGFVEGPATPAYEWAAAYTAVISSAIRQVEDYNRPLHYLPMPGVLAKFEHVLLEEESNALLFDGISAWDVNANGVVQLKRSITMYQRNDAGIADTVLLKTEALLYFAFLATDLNAFTFNRFIIPRYKIADDNAPIRPGALVINQPTFRAELLGRMKLHYDAGLIENFEQLSENLIVERLSSNEGDGFAARLTPDLTNQFRIAGLKIEYLI